MQPRLFFLMALLLIGFSAAGQPKIKFEKKVIKFDKVKAGEPLSFDFFYTNTGSEPLILTNIKVSCTCTTFDYPKEPIPPGETAVIKVYFDTKGKYGYQDRVLEVYTKAHEAPPKIRFRGVVDNKPDRQ